MAPCSLRGADDASERLRRLNFTDSQGLVIRSRLLVAGVYPQQFFPKLHVDAAVHPGGTVKGPAGALRFRDRTVCEGTFGEMFEDAVAAIAKNLRRRSVVRGVSRIDELEIPEVFLCEAVTNALLHRSYSNRFDGRRWLSTSLTTALRPSTPVGSGGNRVPTSLTAGRVAATPPS